MKGPVLFCVLLCLSISVFSQSVANTWSVKFSDAITTRYTPTINAMTSKGWEYSNSIILLGMEKVYKKLPVPSSYSNYVSYIQAYIDSYVNSSGVISATISTLDGIHPGILCLFLYQQTGLTKYKTAAKTLRDFLVASTSTYPKTPEGGYWHKNTAGYKNVMMLDGIFMAHTFLAEYGAMFNDNVCFDTAANQTLLLSSHLYDPTTHLIKHAWNSDKLMAWADGTTGNSPEVWSRGMGWFVVALVEMLHNIPTSHPKYAALKTLLGNLAIGLQTYQDNTTGLWYQVVDKGASPGNYLETSGSGMFIYALKTAVDSGYISSSYLAVATKGWTGLQTMIGTYSDGKPQINQFAPAMSVQATYTAYVSSPNLPVNSPVAAGTQHPHGYAGLLLAASAMEFPIGILPIRISSFTATPEQGEVHLNWQGSNDEQVAYYSVQKSLDGINFIAIGKVNRNAEGQYSYTDENTAGNKTYYRIQATRADQSAFSSTVLTVRPKMGIGIMNVSPNPVTNGMVNIHFDRINPGNYKLKVISSEGKLLAAKLFTVGEEGSVRALKINAGGLKGICFVRLETASGEPML